MINTNLWLWQESDFKKKNLRATQNPYSNRCTQQSHVQNLLQAIEYHKQYHIQDNFTYHYILIHIF